MWNMGAYTSEFIHADFSLWNQHQKLLANTKKPVTEVDPQTNKAETRIQTPKSTYKVTRKVTI